MLKLQELSLLSLRTRRDSLSEFIVGARKINSNIQPKIIKTIIDIDMEIEKRECVIKEILTTVDEVAIIDYKDNFNF